MFPYLVYFFILIYCSPLIVHRKAQSVSLSIKSPSGWFHPTIWIFIHHPGLLWNSFAQLILKQNSTDFPKNILQKHFLLLLLHFPKHDSQISERQSHRVNSPFVWELYGEFHRRMNSIEHYQWISLTTFLATITHLCTACLLFAEGGREPSLISAWWAWRNLWQTLFTSPSWLWLDRRYAILLSLGVFDTFSLIWLKCGMQFSDISGICRQPKISGLWFRKKKPQFPTVVL